MYVAHLTLLEYHVNWPSTDGTIHGWSVVILLIIDRDVLIWVGMAVRNWFSDKWHDKFDLCSSPHFWQSIWIMLHTSPNLLHSPNCLNNWERNHILSLLRGLYNSTKNDCFIAFLNNTETTSHSKWLSSNFQLHCIVQNIGRVYCVTSNHAILYQVEIISFGAINVIY